MINSDPCVHQKSPKPELGQCVRNHCTHLEPDPECRGSLRRMIYKCCRCGQVVSTHHTKVRW